MNEVWFYIINIKSLMGINSNRCTGQKGLKKKAKSHNPGTPRDEMSCPACRGGHRPHTCGKGRTITIGASQGATITSFLQTSVVVSQQQTLQAAPTQSPIDTGVGEASSSSSSLSSSSSSSSSSSFSSSSSSAALGGGGGGGGGAGAGTGVEARASIPAPVLKMIEQIRQSVIPDLSADGKLHGGERKVATFRAMMQQKRLFHEFPDPDYSKRPNVNLAACAGLRVYFVGWRLHDGNLVLRCRCGGALRP